jgi:peptidoglycan/xylan/chitin deacetylase (PgdA/CDA1 family)
MIKYGWGWMIQILILAAVGLAILGGLFVFAWSVPTWQIFGPAVVRGNATGGRVALTFDDGPSAPFTGQILDILRDRKVAATFFVCGKNVERHPEILQRILAEGHTIGNHTYSHPFPYFHRQAFFASQIDRTQEAIAKVTGLRPAIFRPPYGARWIGLYPVLRERGMRLVNWSDTGFDWLKNADIVGKTLRHLGPGSIILLHDGRNVDPPEIIDRSRTVSALPAIIDGARQAGLMFVSVTEFLR